MVEITNEDSVIRVLEVMLLTHRCGEVIERPSAVLKELLRTQSTLVQRCQG